MLNFGLSQHNHACSQFFKLLCTWQSGRCIYIYIFFNFFLRDLLRHFYDFTAQVRQLRLREIKQLFQHQTIKLQSQAGCSVPLIPPSLCTTLWCINGPNLWVLFFTLFSMQVFQLWDPDFFTEETAITMTSKGFMTSREGTDKTIERWRIQPDAKARVQLLISTNCTWEIYYTSINLAIKWEVPKYTSTPSRIRDTQ